MTPLKAPVFEFGQAPRIIIVEGIDNVGKGTLIEEINNRVGFYQTLKFDKPKPLPVYGNDLKEYQRTSFYNSFYLISSLLAPNYKGQVPTLIFDRFHLGEVVYSPLYRGYSGDYVFDLERFALSNLGPISAAKIRLVLLVAKDPSKLPDDGKSFDVTKAASEQSIFLDAFKRSIIKNKVIVDVQDENGSFRDRESIVNEALYLRV